MKIFKKKRKSANIIIVIISLTTALYMIFSVPIVIFRCQSTTNNYNALIATESSRISFLINNIINVYIYRSVQLSTIPVLLQHLHGYTNLNSGQIAEFRQEMPRLLTDLQYTTGYPEPFTFYLDTSNGIAGLYVNNLDKLKERGLFQEIISKNADELLWEESLQERVYNNKKYMCAIFYKNLTQMAGYPLVLEGILPFSYVQSFFEQISLPKGYCARLSNELHQSIYFAGSAIPEGAKMEDEYFYNRSILTGGFGELVIAIPKSLLLWDAGFILLILLTAAMLTDLLIWVSMIRVINDTHKQTVTFIESLKSSKEFTREMATSPISRIDRIDSVQRNYLSLVSVIKQATDELAEAKTHASRLEFELLQERLNPHMLYNSLSVIKWSALRNSDTRTANIVDLLSRYYRAALNRGSEHILVSDELKMAKDYIDIMNLNQNCRYLLVYDIPISILNRKIIKNIIQTVVENAIVHGFSERVDGLISISAQIIDDDLAFYIHDNGCGVSQEVIAQIHDLTYDNPFSGYGLQNLIKRIKLHNGEDYGIEVQSKKDEGTTVTIHTIGM